MKISLRTLILAAAGLAIPAIASADGAADWKAQCAKCHGADGSGQTAMGKKLGLKDYTSAAVQAEMTDEAMFKATKEGVTNDAGKVLMPAYAEKLTDEEIHDLVAFIRTLKTE